MSEVVADDTVTPSRSRCGKDRRRGEFRFFLLLKRKARAHAAFWTTVLLVLILDACMPDSSAVFSYDEHTRAVLSRGAVHVFNYACPVMLSRCQVKPKTSHKVLKKKKKAAAVIPDFSELQFGGSSRGTQPASPGNASFCTRTMMQGYWATHNSRACHVRADLTLHSRPVA